MRRLIIGVVALAGVACAGISEDSLDWSEVRVVSRDTENGATPMLLTTGAGDRVLAWVSAEGGGQDGRLHFAVTPAGASSALPIVTVTDTLGPIEPHGEAPPKLAEGGDGSLHVLYAVGKVIPGQRFPASALRSIRSEDGGRTWSAPVTVNDGEAFGSHNFHALTAGGGLVVATWLENVRGVSGVSISRSLDGGRTFEPRRRLDFGPSCPCCRTAVAIAHDGTMYLAWRSILEGDVRDIVVSRSTDQGLTWSEPVRPREDGWVYPGCPHAGPSLGVDRDGTVHISWWTGKGGEAGVYHARSTDGGATWEAQPMATGTRSAPSHVQMLVRDGQVLVAWDDGLGQLPSVLFRRSTDGGRHFAPAQRISDDGFAASFPVISTHGDSVSIAWSQRGEESYREYLANRPDMSDPNSVLDLPRVGQSEILLRVALLGG